ncbi:MAG: hypothetical protein ACTSYA_12420 [Candidatus Kariarchaeaceae archaeon]
MRFNEKEFFDFFIYDAPEFSTIIINNKLIEYNSFSSGLSMPYRAFSLLKEINSELGESSPIPPELRESFALDLTEYCKKLKDWCNCLSGGPEMGTTIWCLKLNMKIDKGKELIRFSEITIDGDSLNSICELSFNDAFLSLANIVLFNYYYTLYYYYKTVTTFDAKEIAEREKTKQRSIERKEIDSFVFNYVEFIQKEIKSGKLEPMTLLKNSGAVTLGCLVDLEPVNEFINKVIKYYLSKNEHSEVLEGVIAAFYEGQMKPLNIDKTLEEKFREKMYNYEKEYLERNKLPEIRVKRLSRKVPRQHYINVSLSTVKEMMSLLITEGTKEEIAYILKETEEQLRKIDPTLKTIFRFFLEDDYPSEKKQH